MLSARHREFTRKDAIKLVQRMIRKGTMNYIIRDALLDKGFSVYEANTIIEELRHEDAESENKRIDSTIIGIGLAIITVIMLTMILFLLIAPVQ